MNDQRFFTTHWSCVRQAGNLSSSGRAALEELCRLYWPPLYAFVRRQGLDTHESQDLVQGFFCDLLTRDGIRDADPSRGRFRTFLLAAFKNYHSKQRERQRTQKRGGGQVIISIDRERGEESCRIDPPFHETPESVYEKQWALTLLDRVLERLAQEYHERRALFEAIQGQLSGTPSLETYGQIADRLGLTTAAVKVSAHRLRLRYRDLLREEIGHTVQSRSEVDDEIQDLMNALSGPSTNEA